MTLAGKGLFLLGQFESPEEYKQVTPILSFPSSFWTPCSCGERGDGSGDRPCYRTGEGGAPGRGRGQATLRAGPTSGTVWNSGTSCFSWPFTFSSGRRCNVFVQLWPFGTLLQVMQPPCMYLLASALGTKLPSLCTFSCSTICLIQEAPALIESYYDERLVGCSGGIGGTPGLWQLQRSQRSTLVIMKYLDPSLRVPALKLSLS